MKVMSIVTITEDMVLIILFKLESLDKGTESLKDEMNIEARISGYVGNKVARRIIYHVLRKQDP